MRWRPETRRYVLGCVVIAAYPALTLFPYDWTPPTRTTNGAARDDAGAIDFRAPGVAKSDERPRWIAAAIESNRFSLELRLRPGSQSQSGPARIFTVSADPLHRNLTVGQDGQNLVIRLRTPASDLNGLPPIVVPGVMDTARTVDVHVAVRPETAEVLVDGALRARVAIPREPLENWSPRYQVALGNELTLDRPWLGRVERAVVRTAGFEIDYAAVAGSLGIPARYWTFHEPPQLIPFHPIAPGDVVANVLFFIPFGLVVGTLLRRRAPRPALAIALVLGLAASLSLELLQLIVPSRQPSVTDLILNTAGAAIGALAARRWAGPIAGERAMDV